VYKDGYRIINVFKDSPVDVEGAESFDDVVVAVNGKSIDAIVKEQKVRFEETTIGPLQDIIAANINKKVQLVVFNTKKLEQRELEIIPNSRWTNSKGALLGVQVRFDPVDPLEVQLGV